MHLWYLFSLFENPSGLYFLSTSNFELICCHLHFCAEWFNKLYFYVGHLIWFLPPLFLQNYKKEWIFGTRSSQFPCTKSVESESINSIHAPRLWQIAIEGIKNLHRDGCTSWYLECTLSWLFASSSGYYCRQWSPLPLICTVFFIEMAKVWCEIVSHHAFLIQQRTSCNVIIYIIRHPTLITLISGDMKGWPLAINSLTKSNIADLD